MRHIVFEQYQAQAYQDFLNRLDTIAAKLIAARIDFDPALPLLQIESRILSARSKHAWSLYRIVSLLRSIIKGSPQEPLRQQTFFSQALFYNRLNDSLPELDACFKLLGQMSVTAIDHAESFLLRVLVWELLQALNPLSCKEAQELSENLYHRSAHCQYSFINIPKELHSKIRHYFYSQSDAQKIILLEQVRMFKFHNFLQNDVTPDIIRNALHTLHQGAVRFHQSNHLPLVLNLDITNMESEHKKRVDLLKFLQAQVEFYENPMSSILLERHLDASLFNILDCFDSPVLEPNLRAYMKPADKLKFIFDAIVFRPTDFVQPEWGILTVEASKRFAPTWLATVTTNYFTPASPGAVYVRTKLPNYQFVDLNSNFYDSISDGGFKKRQYQSDTRTLIANLLLRLESELLIKQNLAVFTVKIANYQIAKARLSQQILDLIGILNERVEQIVQYNDSSESLRQFEAMQQAYFGEDTLELRCQQLHDQLEAMTPLILPDLDNSSLLGKDLAKAHAQLQAFQAHDTVMSLAGQFSELLAVTQRIESEYQQEQSQFVFPRGRLHWGRQFPYVSILAFLLGAMGMAVAIGIATGSPYFAYLVVPGLIDYTMPICLLAIAVGTGVLLKSGLNLSRYQFFGKTVGLTSSSFLSDSAITVPRI